MSKQMLVKKDKKILFSGKGNIQWWEEFSKFTFGPENPATAKTLLLLWQQGFDTYQFKVLITAVCRA